MRKNFISALVALTLIIIISMLSIGCGAPKQIKALSVKQVDYFKTAANAAAAQSEALIAASAKVKIEAQNKIDKIQKENKLRFEKLLLETIPKLPARQKEKTIRRMMEEIEKVANEATEKKENINADFESIVAQTDNFKLYIEKMQQIQTIIDAYIQSETAYENLMKRTFNYSSENQLISDTDKLKPEF